MRIIGLLLAIAAGAAIWWGWSGDVPQEAPARAQPPAPIARAHAPEPGTPPPLAQLQAPRSAVTAQLAAQPQDSPALPPFSVLAALFVPGRDPALTLLIGGNAVTVRVGSMIEGFRIEAITPERITLTHLATGTVVDRRLDQASASAGPQAQPVAAAPASGPFGTLPARIAAQPLPAPAMPAQPPQPPLGATVHDNPLVGATLPRGPGQPPPGATGPRPIAPRPGEAPPPGPVARPVPPGTPLPVSR